MTAIDSATGAGAEHQTHREETAAERRSASRILFWLGAGPLFASALVDLPRQRMVGAMTGLGTLTIAEGGLAALVFLFCARYPRQLLYRLAPFAVFLLWGTATVFWASPDVKGAQNLAAYLLFGFALASAGALASRSRTRTERALEWGVRVMDVGGLSLVAASMVLRGWPPNIDKVPWFVHPRAVSLAGLAPLAWHLARWVYGRKQDAIPAALWLAAIFLTLSRMATITSIVLVAAVIVVQRLASHQLGPLRKSGPRIALATLGIAAVLAAVVYVEPFRERVFRGSSARVGRSISMDDLKVSKSDRLVFWEHIANSASESPIIGKGIGSSQRVMSERWNDVGHPHNDYLRVWHDLGAIGVAALLTAFIVWFRVLFHELRVTTRHRSGEATAQLELAGALSLIGLVLPMVTDNAIIYPFVVGPVGVLVGAGIGAQALVRLAKRSRGGEPIGGAGMMLMPIEQARFAWKPKYRIRRRRKREE